MSVKRRFIVPIFIFVLTACSGLPPAELAAFGESVSSAKAAGDLILDEVSAAFPTKTDTKKKSCARNALGVRPCFRVEFALGTPGVRVDEAPEIQVRRLALAVIETYTQMLVDISAGRPAAVIEARGKQLGELADSVGGISLGTGIAVAALPITQITDIAKQIATSATQAAATRSVVKSESDMRILIQSLINDTPALYAFYITQFTGSVKKTTLALNRARLDGNSDEVARLQRQLDNLRSPQGNAAKAVLFESALTEYVKILDQTDQMLVTLRKAITLEDLDPVTRSTEFIKRATATRLLLEGLAKDLKALREEDR